MAVNDLHIEKVFDSIVGNLHNDSNFTKAETEELEKLTENETLAQNLHLHNKCQQRGYKKKTALKNKKTHKKEKGWLLMFNCCSIRFSKYRFLRGVGFVEGGKNYLVICMLGYVS